ncbi:MAG: 3-phosphoshikimate 1-carboxyvinyltransferase, partial [Lachnospiraceae bacterium]
GSDTAPLRISGGRLSGIHYLSPVASAQLKSAVLLAGLYADSPSSVTEPSLSRDHSERMLRHFGAKLHSSTDSEGRPVITIEPAEALHAAQISVPGDISSAAYFIVAALLLPGSELRINKVGVNPTRSGILEVAEAMGGSIEVLSHTDHDAEPTADLLIRASRLHGTEIGGALIPRLIDELPVIAAMACQAEGRTVIRDAAELKLKESNRIRVMTEEL